MSHGSNESVSLGLGLLLAASRGLFFLRLRHGPNVLAALAACSGKPFPNLIPNLIPNLTPNLTPNLIPNLIRTPHLQRCLAWLQTPGASCVRRAWWPLSATTPHVGTASWACCRRPMKAALATDLQSVPGSRATSRLASTLCSPCTCGRCCGQCTRWSQV